MSNRKTELAERMIELKAALDEAAARAGRDPEEVTLVAVSKLHPASDIRALAETGQTEFGENYVQEALGKQEELTDLEVNWHFIGGLQSNKAKFVAGNFELVHSVDSRNLAQALHKKAAGLNVVQDILIQVNISGEAQKSGISEENLHQLADEIMGMHGVHLVGLMTMPPFFDDPERARPVFSRLRELKDGLEKQLGTKLPHLSMGMTGDFVPAVLEGATLVRIGTRIFGVRPPRG
ncbi:MULTISPECIES: YggS family pyridoxal phosphate-dependent enzyme [unclassified Pseudodesulfovibrio]|uniref:YggS family pyridoxal phosphate-dependent enzyme n=1 Tax=unclassified Pseudodesulfovibrio TaxID=2661612 RepID=UPI000FEBF033|nr:MULTISPECIES: YggS family pyridoxal phosphate-dependent enzyme [unclassified Pseudodesulfovibrio]MCJ2166065.1 YggS family pyridoxal phosphate-dependent enzyme [Pseudodesulfovibrio sp. S3-i]RWU02510.1 YggS family pyridoxal phosphate-dependent enzyme [Pseudodesulfovibrio sp. S3]